MTEEQKTAETVEKKEKIVQEKTKGHVLDVSPGCLATDLPAGYIYEGEIHTTAIIREMRGHEEDILAGKGPIVPRLNAVMGNCLEALGAITDKGILKKAASELTAPDRMAILLAIRRVSLGDFYDCKVTCPGCNVEQHTTLDLSEIEIIPMPDRMKRERVDVLSSGTEIKWHVTSAKDEEWQTEQAKKKVDVLSIGLLSRVDAINGVGLDRVKEYKKAIDALKGLSIRDRSEMRSLFEREEGTVETNVEYKCDRCNHEWSAEMNVGQLSFFFPSASQKH